MTEQEREQALIDLGIRIEALMIDKGLPRFQAEEHFEDEIKELGGLDD